MSVGDVSAQYHGLDFNKNQNDRFWCSRTRAKSRVLPLVFFIEIVVAKTEHAACNLQVYLPFKRALRLNQMKLEVHIDIMTEKSMCPVETGKKWIVPMGGVYGYYALPVLWSAITRIYVALVSHKNHTIPKKVNKMNNQIKWQRIERKKKVSNRTQAKSKLVC